MKYDLRGKTAIITGASSGIGSAIAVQFAELGIRLLLTARRKERLEALSQELEKKFEIPVSTFAFDVSNRAACEQFVSEIASEPIDILINNAGLALGVDPVNSANLDDWETMIDTNVKGLLFMTRLISPKMVQQKSGHIVNMGSIAGHEAYRGGSVYCASKHAVSAITSSMKMDLTGTGVRVSMVSPGMVETDFSNIRFHGDIERAKKVYEGMTPLSAEDIADLVTFIVTRPPHVDIMDILVYPTAQSSSYLVHRE
jgi:NADP-dependent 3-hydroxy acid dehydrogenase YdfG